MEQEHKKPSCPLVGQNGNIFNLMAVASQALRQNGMTAETLGGQMITVDLSEGVKINTSAVITADIKASNGVIHVIDTVLMPK